MKQIMILVGLLICMDAMSQWEPELGVGGPITASDTALQVFSTSKGSVPCPKMSTAQRDAISTPQEGHCVWNTDDNQLNVYDGAVWGAVAGSGGGIGTPGTTVDASVARWNGTDGASITDSNILVDGSDNMSGIGTISSGAITSTGLVQTSGSITASGTLSADGALSVGGTVTGQGITTTATQTTIGQGSDEDMALSFDRSSADASIEYDETRNDFLMSTDGVNQKGYDENKRPADRVNFASQNPSAEKLLAGWSSTAATFETTSTASEVFDGFYSFNLDLDNSGEYTETTSVTLSAGYLDEKCEGSIYYIGGTDSLVELQVMVNDVVTATADMPQRADWGQIVKSFDCPSTFGDTVGLRVAQIAAGDPAAIRLDDAYLGTFTTSGSITTGLAGQTTICAGTIQNNSGTIVTEREDNCLDGTPTRLSTGRVRLQFLSKFAGGSVQASCVANQAEAVVQTLHCRQDNTASDADTAVIDCKNTSNTPLDRDFHFFCRINKQ